jgi:hypothetical protein
VKDGGGEEGERERERALGVRLRRVHWGVRLRLIALNIEVDPQRRRFGRRESDFALQAPEEEGVLPSYISFINHHMIYLE